MSVGLCDGDFFQQYVFNLEIMKIARYYKDKNDIVVLNSIVKPEKFTEFFYRQDFPKAATAQKIKLRGVDNLHFGGRAFSNGKYVPLPEDIEKTYPDTSIYSKFPNFTSVMRPTETRKETFNRLIMGTHLRLSLDEQTLWKDFSSQLRRVRNSSCVIYDKNIARIEGYQEGLRFLSENIYKNKDMRYIFLYPMHVKSVDEYVYLSNRINLAVKPQDIYFDIPLGDAEIAQLLAMKSNDKLKPIRYGYNVFKDIKTEKEFKINIEQILLHLYKLKNAGLSLKLLIDYNIFETKQWRMLAKIIKDFSYSLVKNKCVAQYARAPLFPKATKRIPNEYTFKAYVALTKETFLYIKEENPNLFKIIKGE